MAWNKFIFGGFAALLFSLPLGTSFAEELSPKEAEAIARELQAFAQKYPKAFLPSALPHLQLVPEARREDTEKLIQESAEYLNARTHIASTQALKHSEEILRLAEMVDEASVQEAIAAVEATNYFAKGGFADRYLARPFHYFWNLGFHGYQKLADEFAERAAIREAVKEILRQERTTTLAEAFSLLRTNPPPGPLRGWLSKWGSTPFDPLWRWKFYNHHSKASAYSELSALVLGDLSPSRIPTFEEIEKKIPKEQMPRLYMAMAKGLRHNGLYEAARGVLEEYFLKEDLNNVKRAGLGFSAGEGEKLKKELTEQFGKEREDLQKEIYQTLVFEGNRKIKAAPEAEREMVRTNVKQEISPESIARKADDKIKASIKNSLNAKEERLRLDDAYKRISRDHLPTYLHREAFDLILDMMDPTNQKRNIADASWDKFEEGVVNGLLVVIPAGRISSVFAKAAGEAAELGAARVMIHAFGTEVGEVAMTAARLGARTIVGSMAVGGFVFHNAAATLQSLTVGSAAWDHYFRGLFGAALMMGSIDTGKILFSGLVRNGLLAKYVALQQTDLKLLERWSPQASVPLSRFWRTAAWVGDTWTEGAFFTAAGELERLYMGELKLKDLPDSLLRDFAQSLLTIVELRIAGRIANAAPAAERLLAHQVPGMKAKIPQSIFPAAIDRALDKIPNAMRIGLAKELVKREILEDQKKPILDAHQYALGEPRYLSLLREKHHILKDAGFKDPEIRNLMEHWVVGEPVRRWNESETFDRPQRLEKTQGREQLVKETVKYLVKNNGPDAKGHPHPKLKSLHAETLSAALELAKERGLDPAWRLYHFPNTNGMWNSVELRDEVTVKKFNQLLRDKYNGDLHELISNVDAAQLFSPLVETIAGRTITVSLKGVADNLQPRQGTWAMIKQYLKATGREKEFEGLGPEHLSVASRGIWKDEATQDRVIVRKMNQLLREKYNGDLHQLIANVEGEKELFSPLVETIAGRPMTVIMRSLGEKLQPRLSSWAMIKRYLKATGREKEFEGLGPEHLSKASRGFWEKEANQDPVIIRKINQLLRDEYNGDLYQLILRANAAQLFSPLIENIAGRPMTVSMQRIGTNLQPPRNPIAMVERYFKATGREKEFEGLGLDKMSKASFGIRNDEATRDRIIVRGIDQLLQEVYNGNLHQLIENVEGTQVLSPLVETVSGRRINVSLKDLGIRLQPPLRPYAMARRYYELKGLPFPYSPRYFMGKSEGRRERMAKVLNPYDLENMRKRDGSYDISQFGFTKDAFVTRKIALNLMIEEAANFLLDRDIRYLGLEDVHFGFLRMVRDQLNLVVSHSSIVEAHARTVAAMKAMTQTKRASDLRGISIERGDINQHLTNGLLRGPYNLVNLDYGGHLSREKEKAIGRLFTEDGLLESNSVIYITLGNKPLDIDRSWREGFGANQAQAVEKIIKESAGDRWKVEISRLSYNWGLAGHSDVPKLVIIVRASRLNPETKEISHRPLFE